MHSPRTDPQNIRLAFVAETAPEAILVHVTGDADVGTVPMLWSNLSAIREDNLHVVVDLHEIHYIDAAAMETLADAHRLFSQCGQRFLLANPSPVFRMALREIAGSANAIPVFATVAGALASLRSAAPALPALQPV